MVAHIRTDAAFAAALAALSLTFAACSDGGAHDTANDTSTTSAALNPTTDPTTGATTDATTVAASSTMPATLSPLDFNGDGQVVLGVATPGPAEGGGWSQGLVDAARALSAEHGFAAPIVVDNIAPTDAVARIGDLAQQPVDLLIIGAAALAVPLTDLIAQHPDIYWYCNCGAGIAQNAGLLQVTDSGAEIGYTAGYATGLLLDASGLRRATVIGCCDRGLEKQIYNSFEDGLQAVDATFRMTYVRTGDLEYDFDNTKNATDAFQTAVDERTHAVFPFLDGAHRAVARAANDAGKILLSAGSSTACADGELAYDVAVGFDGADYLRAVLPNIIDGTLLEGQTRLFSVGVDPEPGAVICNPTPKQQAAMDVVYARIAAGDFDEQFAKVTEKAFAAEIALAQGLLD